MKVVNLFITKKKRLIFIY